MVLSLLLTMTPLQNVLRSRLGLPKLPPICIRENRISRSSSSKNSQDSGKDRGAILRKAMREIRREKPHLLDRLSNKYFDVNETIQNAQENKADDKDQENSRADDISSINESLMKFEDSPSHPRGPRYKKDIIEHKFREES